MSKIECTRCKKEKLPDAFYDDSQKANGKSSWCIACVKENNALRRQRQAPEDKAKRVAWAASPAGQASRKRSMRRYQQKNKKALKAYQQKWLAEHPGYHKAIYDKKMSPQRKAKIAAEAAWREYKKTHQGYFSQKRDMTRAKKYRCKGKYMTDDIYQLLQIQGERCVICGRDFDIEISPFVVHHIIPLHSKGRNDIGNIQLVHHQCFQKHKNDQIDYRSDVMREQIYAHPSVEFWVETETAIKMAS